MNELKTLVNKLWAGIIENINFDLLCGSFSLNIKVIENGVASNYELIFQEVSAHYFIRNNGENRLANFQIEEEGDYLELTSIDYFDTGIGDITIKSTANDWVKQYFSSANFVLEIWSSILFIEAKKLTINGIVFDI